MRYYYSNKGKPDGPHEENALDELFRQGVIRPTTPVIEEGSSIWSTFAALRPEVCKERSQEKPRSVSEDGRKQAAVIEKNDGIKAAKKEKNGKRTVKTETLSLMGKVLSINVNVDRILDKIFRFPSFVPADRDGQLKALGLMSGFSCLTIWLTCIVAGGVAASFVRWQMVPGLFVGAIYGFIVQYLIYQISQSVNSLLIGHPVVLSSDRTPRFIGTVLLLICLVLLLTMIVRENNNMVLVFLTMCILLPCLGMVYICFNAEKTVVKVCLEQVSPGREFNNNAKFVVRVLLLSVHVLTPVLAALVCAASIFLFLSQMGGSISQISLSLLISNLSVAVGIVVHMPLIIWLVLGVTSWFLDTYDAIMSRNKV